MCFKSIKWIWYQLPIPLSFSFIIYESSSGSWKWISRANMFLQLKMLLIRLVDFLTIFFWQICQLFLKDCHVTQRIKVVRFSIQHMGLFAMFGVCFFRKLLGWRYFWPRKKKLTYYEIRSRFRMIVAEDLLNDKVVLLT